MTFNNVSLNNVKGLILFHWSKAKTYCWTNVRYVPNGLETFSLSGSNVLYKLC